jgi:dTDP-4-dehydrorhamnose reductase
MNLWIPGKGLVGTALAELVPALNTGREVDIANFDVCCRFVEKNRVTHIVNCAAFSQVDLAEVRPEEAHRANAIGPEVLGRAAKEMGAKLLHLSTDYVFDGLGSTLKKETDPTGPCNVYGKSKLEGELRLFAVMPEACVLRTSWVFGKGGKNFVTKLLELLQTQDELKLVRDQVSRPTYAPDLARAILALLGCSGLYHFANAEPTNKYDFALALQAEADFRCRSLLPVSSSEFAAVAKRPLFSALDTTKIEPLFKPRPWRDCLKEYLHVL